MLSARGGCPEVLSRDPASRGGCAVPCSEPGCHCHAHARLPAGLLPPPASPAQNPPLSFPRRTSQAAQGDFTTLIPGNC